MHSIGFIISHKNNEERRALLPQDLQHIRHKRKLCFEEGYGLSLGIPDTAYIKQGVKMVPGRKPFSVTSSPM